MSENPYTTPQSFETPALQVTGAEEIRRAHIGHEASIKSVGVLYILGAIFTGLGTIAAFGGMLADKDLSGGESDIMVGPLAGVIFAAITIGYALTGSAIRKIKPWSRVVVGILSGLGLIAFPVGTLINGYILYLFFSKKGKMVFSPEYKDIITATPHVKYKTSKWVWIVLAALVVIPAIVIAILVFFSKGS